MLIDDVRDLLGRDLPPGLLERLTHAVVFRIDEVVPFVQAQLPRAYRASDLPNVAPLARSMWFEWTYAPAPLTHMGTLLSVEYDLADSEERAEFALVHADWGCPPWLDEVRWLANGWTFIGRPHDMCMVPQPACFAIGPAGLLRRAVGLDIEDENGRVDAYAQNVILMLTAICFAHCKGVAMMEHQQPRQQRRAAERAGRPPFVTYKTIDIAPVTRILRDEGNIATTGLKKALHITRAHFAHYTEDAPLFGKYTGTFYRPMHLRGTLERGAVLKDYRVLPGDENAGPPALSQD